MDLGTLYHYELKKLFCTKVNLIALAGSVVLLVLLAKSSITESMQVSRETAEILDGRVINGQMIEELKPIFKEQNGVTVLKITREYEKYVPILNVIQSVTGYESNLRELLEKDFYELREQKIAYHIEKQELGEAERDYWQMMEGKIPKPFVYRHHSGPENLLKSFQALGFFILLLSAIGLSGVYARETADNMNQLLLCSRYGKKELYMIKYAAGITWILAAAGMVILSVLIPFYAVFGMEGMSEMLQLVKPLSMIPVTIGQMLMIYVGIYLMTAVLYASVTMLLSVITKNQLAATGALVGYLLVDMFVEFPERQSVLQRLWSLRPNAVLMNTGFSNYRLIHLLGRFYLNYQAAPALYGVIILAAMIIGRNRYLKIQVGK